MSGLGWDEELPVKQLPNDERWRENFCFNAYDPRHDVGLWFHIGRWSLDPRIWREQVQFMLPDGSYLVHRAWGLRDSSRGPAGASLDCVCEKPGQAWRFSFRGPMRRTTTAEMQKGPLPEGPQILVDAALEFRSSRPPWHLGAAMKGQAWGSSHYEQTGHMSGDVSYEGNTVKLSEAIAWRDHSRGRRDIGSIMGTCWIQGELPGGRSFALTYLEHEVGGARVPGLEKAVVWDADGTMYEATSPKPPYLKSAQAPAERYTMSLISKLGTFEIEAKILRSLPHSTSHQNETFDGVTPTLAHQVTYEQPTLFQVDGEQTIGHTERCFAFRQPSA